MADFQDWHLYGESLARCLVAVAPEFGSTMFTEVMNRMSQPGPPASGQGRWYRALKGYIHIGPEGGDHHYQREPPADVPAAEIGDMGVKYDDTLVRELGHFLTRVETVSIGEPVQMPTNDGQSLTFQASGDELVRLRALAETLRGARDACHPDYNRAVTLQIHAGLVGLLQSAMAKGGADPQAVVDVIRAGAAQVMELRWRYAADARITALFFVQTRLCELALQEYSGDQLTTAALARLSMMAMEGRGEAFDTEQMLMQLIVDFSRQGMGNLLVNLCDEALSSAQNGVEDALNAKDLPTHAQHLYSAAHFAFASLRLAEGLRELVPESARPKANDNLLEGYARNADEIVTRAGHALVIGSINRGSGAAIKYHIDQVRLTRRAAGPQKAQTQVNTLINDFYFYPRYYAETLRGEDGPTPTDAPAR